MKKYNHILLATLYLFLVTGCKENDIPGDTGTELEITGISVTLGNTITAETVRATESYIVNSDNDPTSSIRRSGWELDLEIFHDGSPYAPGKGTFTYNSILDEWESPVSPLVFFPNYTKQLYNATCHPNGWDPSDPFIKDQSQLTSLQEQDILCEAQNSYVIPAKVPKIKLEHAFSMLNFKLGEVDPDQLEEVTVRLGQEEYKPYPVSELEYLLIVEVNKSTPIICFTTVEGIEYQQEVNISKTERNTCYCFTLSGVELLLSPITVKNWSTGEALSGNNTTVTAYPTFRGPKNKTFIFHYDNGLEQLIEFNSQGECTIRPAGRIIEKIDYSGKSLPLKYIIRDMIIDLTDELEDLIQ